jgi:hypothetical protein
MMKHESAKVQSCFINIAILIAINFASHRAVRLRSVAAKILTDFAKFAYKESAK